MDRMTISIRIVNITTGWQREKKIGNKSRKPVPIGIKTREHLASFDNANKFVLPRCTIKR